MRWIVAVVVAFASVGAWAGYAQMAPPAGFTQAGAAFTYGGSAAANAPFVGGSAAAQVTTNVGGRVVTMSAPMRLAANAASFAVAAIRLNPTTLAVGAVAVWLATEGITLASGAFQKNDTTPIVEFNCGTGVPGYPGCTAAELFSWAVARGAQLGWGSCTGARLQYTSGTPGTLGAVAGVRYVCSGTGAGEVWADNGTQWAVSSVGTVGTRPAVDADFAPLAAASTLADDVANALRPFVPLPVVAPWVAPNPLPAPVRVPIAEPVPLPGTDPQRYRQPVETVKPAPLPDMPFRYDQQPGWLEGESPVGLTEPTPVGESDPVPTPGAPVELETCGLPDTPECVISGKGVETGSADQKFAGQKSAMDTAGDDIKGKIDNPTKPTSLAWGFTSGLFGIPAASCQPFSWGSRLGAVTVDVCNNSLVNTMRGMLAWMMYALTLLYVWRRANESLERTA
jgi:hypothetical protein